ncbi:uncharacterized protein LOC118349229 [Juglans regia]|uniref:Uncharacterized protein LOC118349229 n=1 Tax=Juglans regia TaxID=51240 RepID=A0A6P9EMT0_JUGRE|nr:uncharacterized protein LOC118349229 [Juglans regia]
MGVIRDNCGRLLAAYSVFLGPGSNNFTEMRSNLLECVRRCYQLGFSRVEIETDSQRLVNWIIEGDCNIWYLEDFWDELHVYLNCIEYGVSHVFREDNVMADFLAKWGVGGLNSDGSGDYMLPDSLRCLLRMEISDLPYLRIL